MYNQQPSNNTHQRRYIVAANSLTSNTLHFRNPWLAAWWSAAFPGFGQFLLGSYIFGFILMTVEFVLNSYTHINKSIFYSMIGTFEQARSSIKIEWLLFLPSIIIFSAYYTYMMAIENNEHCWFFCLFL